MQAYTIVGAEASRTFRLNPYIRRVLIGVAVSLGVGLKAPSAAAAGCDQPAAVQFSPGAVTAEVAGGLPRGERDCFVISANAGQPLSVVQEPAPDNNIVFQLYRPGWKIIRSADGTDVSGVTLPGAGEGDDARTWSGSLTAKGNYLMVVGTTRGGGEYRIRVERR